MKKLSSVNETGMDATPLFEEEAKRQTEEASNGVFIVAMFVAVKSPSQFRLSNSFKCFQITYFEASRMYDICVGWGWGP